MPVRLPSYGQIEAPVLVGFERNQIEASFLVVLERIAGSLGRLVSAAEQPVVEIKIEIIPHPFISPEDGDYGFVGEGVSNALVEVDGHFESLFFGPSGASGSMIRGSP